MSTAKPIRTVGVRELRQDASAILRRVKSGEVIEVTEHGKPVAQIQPITESAFEAWINSKLITPAKAPGTLSSIKPVKASNEPSSKELLDYSSADKI